MTLRYNVIRARVAQRIEQVTSNLRVAGSTPVVGTHAISHDIIPIVKLTMSWEFCAMRIFCLVLFSFIGSSDLARFSRRCCPVGFQLIPRDVMC